jgi:hypothetical protein
MSYRDYEEEDRQREYKQKLLEEKTKQIKIRLEQGQLADILAELSIYKQDKY